MEDVSPEILKYVLEETDDRDYDISTTESITTEDSMAEVIIEGEFVEAEDESCSTNASEVYQILDSKSYTMSSDVATEKTSATIIFQQVDVEDERKVNFGKWSPPRYAAKYYLNRLTLLVY